MSSMLKQVMIADDHPIFRKGLREIIETHADYEVVAEAESGVTAWQHYQAYRPDVVVLDISMGEVNGLEVAEKILSKDRHATCVMMTMYGDAVFCKRALSIGVKGYLLKDDVLTTIVTCLNTVASGKIFISERLGDAEQYLSTQHDWIESSPEQLLSAKELVILRSIAALKTNKEIAREQNISHRTVQNHRQNISNKLNLSGRQALLQFAVKWVEHQSL